MGEPAMVKESARPHLKALSKLSTELNKASDQYTKELESIEAELSSLNLGLELTLSGWIHASDAWEDEEEDRDGDLRTFTIHDKSYLAYGKHRGEWHLLVKTYRITENHPQTGDSEALIETVPLLQASRDLRIASAGRILDLLGALQEEANKKIAALKKVSDSRNG